MKWIKTYIDLTIPETTTPQEEVQALNNTEKLDLFAAFLARVKVAHVKQLLLADGNNFVISRAAIRLIYTEFEEIAELSVLLASGAGSEPIPASETALKTKVVELHGEAVLTSTEAKFVVGKVVDYCKRDAAGAYVGTYSIFKEVVNG